MTNMRKRLPEEVFEQVFAFVLKVAVEHRLLKGKTIAVDSTTLEANAAMKSLVRRDTGEDWKTYVRRLTEAEGIEDPTDEEVRRFDRKRKKKTSNKEWKSATDPDSRVTKMKDGRTHLAYKAEHAVDLDSEIVVAAVVYRADDVGCRDVAGDVEIGARAARGGGEPAPSRRGGWPTKGTTRPRRCRRSRRCKRVRTYIAEPEAQGTPAVAGQARRAAGSRVREPTAHPGTSAAGSLGRLRSERARTSFAHTCETGGGRRAWLRGVVNVSKSYLMRAAACNLGIIMLALFGVGTPRSLQGGLEGVFVFLTAASAVILSFFRVLASIRRSSRSRKPFVTRAVPPRWSAQTSVFSTGC